MKKHVGTLLIGIILVLSFSVICFAKDYDFSNMTVSELEELKEKIDDEIKKNHSLDSEEKSSVKEAVVDAVEDEYGEDNVNWAWVNYTYTKDWDYYTLKTHADIVKQDGGKAKYDIFGEVVANGSKYKVAYLKVGNEELINKRGELITDERVIRSLGLDSEKNSKDSSKKTASSDTKSEEKEEKEEKEKEKEETEDVIIISATDLYNAFDNNAISAEEKYKGKTVQVTGVVGTIDEDIWGSPYVRLNADEFGISSVSCYFPKKDKSNLASINSGETVTVEGVCGEMGFMDVDVKNCSLIE